MNSLPSGPYAFLALGFRRFKRAPSTFHPSPPTNRKPTTTPAIGFTFSHTHAAAKSPMIERIMNTTIDLTELVAPDA
jgi:hypothetical protein